jgi:anti-sigma factor RsiW
MMEATTVDCKKIQMRLSAYLDGELAPAGAATVEEHLRGCPRCAAELAGLQALSLALTHALEGATEPSGFAARIRRAAAARQARRRPIMLFGDRPGLRPALLRVAAGLIAVAGLWVGMSVGGSAFGRIGQSLSNDAQASEQNEFALQVETLSAAPPGSIAEAYLAFSSYEEDGGQGDDQ